jgi:hypothetical protein
VKPNRCDMPEAHDAHMQMNGECPWCYVVDESAIREPAEWDFHDAKTVYVSVSTREIVPTADEMVQIEMGLMDADTLEREHG